MLHFSQKMLDNKQHFAGSFQAMIMYAVVWEKSLVRYTHACEVWINFHWKASKGIIWKLAKLIWFSQHYNFLNDSIHKYNLITWGNIFIHYSLVFNKVLLLTAKIKKKMWCCDLVTLSYQQQDIGKEGF